MVAPALRLRFTVPGTIAAMHAQASATVTRFRKISWGFGAFTRSAIAKSAINEITPKAPGTQISGRICTALHRSEMTVSSCPWRAFYQSSRERQDSLPAESCNDDGGHSTVWHFHFTYARDEFLRGTIAVVLICFVVHTTVQGTTAWPGADRSTMRIRISHETRYHYDAPTSGVIQTLRLTPRNHDGHYVVHWRIDVTEDCRLDLHEDAFGNIANTFTAEGPFAELGVQVEGEVDVQDTAGIVRGAIERFPPSLYLRATPLTEPGGAIADFARETRSQADDTLPLLHALLGRIHGEMTYDTDPTHTTTTAAEAFALKRGVCQDLTHIFIAAARHLDIPARYVGGYFHRNDGVTRQQ